MVSRAAEHIHQQSDYTGNESHAQHAGAGVEHHLFGIVASLSRFHRRRWRRQRRPSSPGRHGSATGKRHCGRSGERTLHRRWLLRGKQCLHVGGGLRARHAVHVHHLHDGICRIVRQSTDIVLGFAGRQVGALLWHGTRNAVNHCSTQGVDVGRGRECCYSAVLFHGREAVGASECVYCRGGAASVVVMLAETEVDEHRT